MKLTTRGRYAVTAMMDLALQESINKPVTLKSIADHQEISIAYLEHLFAKLKAKHLVRGVRGPGGGYKLARPAEEISIFEIINAVDETVELTRCHGREDCQDGEVCLTHELWTELSNKMMFFLDELMLGNIVQTSRVREVAKRQSILCGDRNQPQTQHVAFS
jgi:Rrf2 family iron-sulfur cluster assembly transcriptional regulator